MGFGGTIRNPGSKRREGRSWDRLSGKTAAVNPSSAIQLDNKGRIVLVIATGEPFTQSVSGLALTIDSTLAKTSSVLGVEPHSEYKRIIYYG